MNTFLIVLTVLFILVCTFLGFLAIFSYLRLIKEQNDIKSFEINTSTISDTEALKALDNLIEDTMTNYILLNRGWKSGTYITSEEEQKIAKEVGELVQHRISPVMMDKLSFFYSAEALSEIIGEKIYIRVMSYSLDQNKVKQK